MHVAIWAALALCGLTLPALAQQPASTAVHPIHGASLFGGSGSLFDRFNSLFGRLGGDLHRKIKKCVLISKKWNSCRPPRA